MRWRFESADARSAYAARNDLVHYLQSRATSDSDIAAAELIFGELVGNVVRHAPGPIAVHVEWEEGDAVLTVSDRGGGFAWEGTPTAPDMLSENGRGLFIVSQLAREMSMTREAGGTKARVRLPVSRG